MDTSANSLETRALAPYKSLLVAQLRPQRYRSSILAAVWDGIAALVEATNIARIVDRSEWTEAGNDLMALYYREERQSENDGLRWPRRDGGKASQRRNR